MKMKHILTENARKFVQRGVRRPVTSTTVLEAMIVLKKTEFRSINKQGSFSALIPDSAEAVRGVAEEERADDATGVEERLRERRPPRVVANPVHLL